MPQAEADSSPFLRGRPLHGGHPACQSTDHLLDVGALGITEAVNVVSERAALASLQSMLAERALGPFARGGDPGRIIGLADITDAFSSTIGESSAVLEGGGILYLERPMRFDEHGTNLLPCSPAYSSISSTEANSELAADSTSVCADDVHCLETLARLEANRSNPGRLAELEAYWSQQQPGSKPATPIVSTLADLRGRSYHRVLARSCCTRLAAT